MQKLQNTINLNIEIDINAVEDLQYDTLIKLKNYSSLLLLAHLCESLAVLCVTTIIPQSNAEKQRSAEKELKVENPYLTSA